MGYMKSSRTDDNLVLVSIRPEVLLRRDLSFDYDIVQGHWRSGAWFFEILPLSQRGLARLNYISDSPSGTSKVSLAMKLTRNNAE